MKKILLILFLFLSIVGQAQMIIADEKQAVALNSVFTYRIYYAPNPTKNFVIWLPGTGERGPIDGTMLPRVEKIGWPGFAKGIRPGQTEVTGTFDFPFNIVVLQVEANYNTVAATFPQFVKTFYKAETIIVTGLSLGGGGTYAAAMADKKLCLIYAYAIVCGTGKLSEAANYPAMKAVHYHGTNDGEVAFKTAEAFVKAYNATHGGLPIEFVPYQGVGHSAWLRAYSVKPGEDQLLQKVIKWFAEAYKPDFDKEAWRAKIIEYVKGVN